MKLSTPIKTDSPLPWCSSPSEMAHTLSMECVSPWIPNLLSLYDGSLLNSFLCKAKNPHSAAILGTRLRLGTWPSSRAPLSFLQQWDPWFIASWSEVQVVQDLHWLLKWGQSCGTEPWSCGVCINPRQLVSELNRIAGLPAGVGVVEKMIDIDSRTLQNTQTSRFGPLDLQVSISCTQF